MDRKSIAQEYFILVTDKDGNLPVMYKEEAKAGIVAASFMDLLLNGVISVEKKRITVTQELPEALEYVASLYTYLAQKECTVEKLMRDYMTSTSVRIKRLITDIGESLAEDDAVSKGTGGLFGNKTVYIPEEDYKEKLVGTLTAITTNEDEISLHDMALISVLKETKNLNQYFSKYEKEALKAKLKEIKKNPQCKQLAEMINYVEDMIVSIVFFLLVMVSV